MTDETRLRLSAQSDMEQMQQSLVADREAITRIALHGPRPGDEQVVRAVCWCYRLGAIQRELEVMDLERNPNDR